MNDSSIKPFFQLIDVSFNAPVLNGDTFSVIKRVNMSIGEGEWVSVVGRNGSGKTTLSRLLCGLLNSSTGNILIKGRKIEELKKRAELQKTIGYLFSNPENQIIYPTVEEDVAFGPINLGFPPDEVIKGVKESLRIVGLEGYEKKAVSLLSSGEMKKVALAGIIAMSPESIILDEPFLMLDQKGTHEMSCILKGLKDLGITIVSTMSSLEETTFSDRIFILKEGEIVLEGGFKEIISEREVIERAGLVLPEITQLVYQLRERGIDVPVEITNVEDLAEFIHSSNSKSLFNLD